MIPSNTNPNTAGGGAGEPGPPTVRDVLRLLWDADRYPHLGNEDNRIADILEEEALAAAPHAVRCPDDPPELAEWLAILQDGKLSNDARASVMSKLYDLFDSDDRQEAWA